MVTFTRRQTKSEGFTLYETLLVLVLTTGLLILTAAPRAASQKVLAEQAFWPTWQRFWTASCQLAIRRHESLYVEIDTARHRAFVRQLKQAHPHPRVLMRLPIPASLHVESDKWAQAITRRGWAAALTLEWYSRRTHLWWYQTFQLKGALIYVTVSPYQKSAR